MIKTKLNLRLKAKYEQKICEYLQELKKNGYIVSSDDTIENKYIVKYNVQKQDFIHECSVIDFFEKKIERFVPNEFDVQLQWIDIINMILENLPYASSSDLESFQIYEKYEVTYAPFDELEDELNDFKKLSKSLTKEIDLTNFMNANNQAIMLNSELVFYTADSDIGNISDQKSYFKFDKKTKTFVKLSANQIHELLVKKFKINPNSLEVRDIKRNMRTIYNELVNTSTLPIRWNQNVKAENKLKNVSKGYKNVKKITDCFE